MGYLDKKHLIDLMIGLSNHTDPTTYKLLGTNETAPAGQTIKGGEFDVLVHNTLAANTVSVGAVGSSYGTVVEEGTGTFHKSTITLGGAFGAIVGGASLGLGRLIYTFPAGIIRINSVAFVGVALQQTEGNVTADTPELGVGSVIAVGAVSVLSGTGTFEDILTGQVMTDCDGTGKTVALVSDFTVLPAAAHTVHLNVADGWAASGDAALGFTGDVVITWEFLS